MERALSSLVCGLGAFSAWVWLAFVGTNTLEAPPQGYVVGQFCIWDAGAMLVLGTAGAVVSWRGSDVLRRRGVLGAALSYAALFAWLFFGGTRRGAEGTWRSAARGARAIWGTDGVPCCPAPPPRPDPAVPRGDADP